MTRQTITITTANGAKVRTVASKRYFVVQAIVTAEGQAVAKVVRRTDSAISAQSVSDKSYFNSVYVLTTKSYEDHTPVARLLTDTEVHNRALSEKESKAFAKSVGNNGEARRLSY